ncbi:MAG TPA: type IV toxin-antitoxin system AbiEi family antitoxin domain-containing protein [Solirubrobacterales bacterium]|jgi:very-short-patch-repair endonuclease
MQTDGAEGTVEAVRAEPVEARLAALARRQHGIVARRQLLSLNVTKEEIDGRVRSGGLHLIHRGVYAVGHMAITQRGRWMAAVLASGEGAVLSHRSAAALWRIWGSGAGQVHVTLPRKTRSGPGMRRHYSLLPNDEKAVVDGIPVTSAARAVLDLAAEKGEAAAEAALREMEYLGIYGAVSLPALLDRHPRHLGTSLVREALEHLRDDPGGRIRSTLEELFLPFLDAHRIRRPHLNAWLSIGEHRYQVDCLWPEPRLIGELDDFQSHGTKRGFRRDRTRDRRLGAAGYRVVRITKGQLVEEPSEVAADLRTLLK